MQTYPTHPPSRDELKQALIHYREKVLSPRYGTTPRARAEGILRRNMIDAILDIRPQSPAEFKTLLPPHLIAGTSRMQLAMETMMVLRIVRCAMIP